MTVCKTVRHMLSDVVCPICLTVMSVTLVYCGQMVGWIKMKHGMQVGIHPGHIVLDGDPATHPPKGGEVPPQFSAHVHCGQTAGWVKMPLGINVGLGPGYIVLDWDPALLPKKGAEPLPNFWPMSIVVKCPDGSKWHLARRWALVQATLC